jgi:hypothetical protein
VHALVYLQEHVIVHQWKTNREDAQQTGDTSGNASLQTELEESGFLRMISRRNEAGKGYA